jgi:hypothetical protein
MAQGGSKETKDDHISTNPRYSKMLSMIQQSLAKGIIDFIYKHLTTRYTNSEGILTQTVDKDKIEVLFKSSTNINNKLEEERLMLKVENMSNTLNLVDDIASSPNVPVKVKGDNFLQYWHAELEKNPFLRDIFEKMTPEEMRAQFGPDETPNTGDEAQGAEEGGKQPAEQPQKGEKQEEAPQQKQEVEQVVKQPQEAGDTKEEEVIRSTFQ